MEYVIAFQGFYENANNFISGELCLQSIQNLKLDHVQNQFLFFPSFDIRHLSNEKKKVVNYLKNCYNKFSMNCGLQTYDEVYKIFKDLSNAKGIIQRERKRKKYSRSNLIQKLSTSKH